MEEQRPSLEIVEDFLCQEHLAIVGISREPASFSKTLFEEFCRRGYDVVPVNPHTPEVLGRRCFANVQQIEPPVEAALLMTPPDITDAVVRDCAEAGVRRVWMYRASGHGSVSSKAVQFCQERGIRVVPGECPFMFWPNTGALHRFHGLVRKITGQYPVRARALATAVKTDPAATASRARRAFEVTVAVAIWIALGISLHLDVRTYLLLGIPLTAAFQWGVRRNSLRALWVRDAVPFRLDAMGWMIAAFLAIVPMYRLVTDFHAKAPGATKAFDVAALAGAFAVAYSLRNLRRAATRPLLLCLLIAGGIGIAIMFASGLGAGFAQRNLWQRLAIGLGSLLMFVPVSFVLEEVSFRGAFDAHIHHPAESKGIASALFVSALWGLWHLPVVLGQAPLVALVPQLLVVHCAIGVPLSIFWRQSGNLFVTGSTHALIDAVRNALLVLPWH